MRAPFVLFEVMVLFIALTARPFAQISPFDSLKKEIDSFDRDQDSAKTAIKKAFFNFDDTLTSRILITRLNLAGKTDASFIHDAGDYLKFDPSVFCVEEQNTPYRKTVSPAGLPGRRINAIYNNRSLNPLEHLPEPDGQINFEDIPTTGVENLYILGGPAAMMFGGDEAPSSIILSPLMPESTTAESRLIVDKGAFGYANTGARFAQRTAYGRLLRAALEYRKATGATYYRNDDGYHQWGEFSTFLTEKWRMNLSGRLYSREGTYTLRPDVSLFSLERKRRDRDLTAGLDFYHSEKATTGVEFRHQRSESRLYEATTLYSRNLDFIANSITARREFQKGGSAVKAAISYCREEFRDAPLYDGRDRFNAELRSITPVGRAAYFALLRGEKVEGFDAAGSAVAGIIIDKEYFFALASAGYGAKFPSQYDLSLTPRLTRTLSYDSNDYFESGAGGLIAEKQAVGNVTLALGRIGSDLSLSCSFGRIGDAIRWRKYDYDTAGATVKAYKPFNDDLKFVSVTATQNFKWKDILRWYGGGGYHFVESELDETLAYSPDYQLTAGIEIYKYIRKLELHLFAILEGVYYGRYFGAMMRPLGEDPIINLKLSFRIKAFKFYYIFQNLPSIEYQRREDYTIPGRFNFYGFHWDFLD
jgi:hypothetical protein